MADPIRVLVVEGNDRANTETMRALGGTPYGVQYAALLESMDPRVQCDVARPSEEGPNVDLSPYAGVAWTGSAMSAYEERPEVENQIRLARRAFDAGLPVFGSCWGLQIAAVALGGAVRANPRGREIGIAPEIALAPGAQAHPMFQGRPQRFSALAVHRDEVAELPDGAQVLASNPMSAVQAMTVERDGIDFWGVQYHPEFDFHTLALIYRRLGSGLVREGACRDETEVQAAIERLEAYQAGASKLPPELKSAASRSLEIRNWLDTKLSRP